jgi:DNA-binding NarL/FixJ family response regulator
VRSQIVSWSASGSPASGRRLPQTKYAASAPGDPTLIQAATTVKNMRSSQTNAEGSMVGYEADEGLRNLTKREREIVGLLVTGATAQEIASGLRLSFHTVRTHIRNVYAKLGICNRVELIRYLVDRSELARL